MAFESTAINDLIAGLQQRPLQRDTPNDWLFGEPERADATEIDTSRQDKATTPFDRTTPPVVSLPQPFVRQPAPALDYIMHRPSSPTTHVRAITLAAIAKRMALPIGLFCIVVVLVGVYFAKSETKPASAPAEIALTVKAVEADPVNAEPMKAEPVAADPAPSLTPAAGPIVTPIEEPAPDVATAGPASEAAKTEPAPQVAKVEPAPQVAKVEPAPQVAKVEPAPQVAKVEPAPQVTKVEPAPKPEPANVEPGSPAARFLGASPAEPTIPTVAPKAAPAPTTVPDLRQPPKPEPEALGVEIAAKPEPVMPTKKKSAVQLRAEKRAAAKRAAKASIAASKARSRKPVATKADPVDDEEAEETEAPAKKTAAAKQGKGVLSIASTPALEVWVDGRNSKAQTPVRIILLSGKHQVTLFNKATSKARSFDVEIKPDETTKIVKNYQ